MASVITEAIFVFFIRNIQSIASDVFRASGGTFSNGDRYIKSSPLGTLILLPFFLALPMRTSANNLDPTFGSGGVTIRQFVTSSTTPRSGTASAIQTDGKIVLSGIELSASGSEDFVSISRFNADGSPDINLGTGGRVSLSVGFFEDVADLKIQADGKARSPGQVSSDPP